MQTLWFYISVYNLSQYPYYQDPVIDLCHVDSSDYYTDNNRTTTSTDQKLIDDLYATAKENNRTFEDILVFLRSLDADALADIDGRNRAGEYNNCDWILIPYSLPDGRGVIRFKKSIFEYDDDVRKKILRMGRELDYLEDGKRLRQYIFSKTYMQFLQFKVMHRVCCEKSV
jgi:hypothetical protein